MSEGSYSSDQIETIDRAIIQAYKVVSGGKPIRDGLVEITKSRLMKAMLAAYDAGIHDHESLVAVAVERIREIDRLS